MSLVLQRLQLKQTKENIRLKEGEKKLIGAWSRLALIIGATFVMLALVFTR